MKKINLTLYISDLFELMKKCVSRVASTEDKLDKFMARYEDDNYRFKDRATFEKENPALDPLHKINFPLRTRRQLYEFAKALRNHEVLAKFVSMHVHIFMNLSYYCI
jgi:hypothetical protein